MSKRRRKDPDAPVPYKSAYLHFANARRQEILRERPDMDCQEISKELGRIWKNLSAYERKPWLDVAGHDRARYEAEMKNYNNPLLREAWGLEEEVVDIQRRRDPKAPKPSKSAYIHFWKDKREDILRMNPGIAFHDVTKEIGRVWRSMGPDERQPWVDLAAADRQRYEEELRQYEPPAPSRKKKEKRKIRDPNAPKAPKTGFQYLLEHRREEMTKEDPGISFNVITREVSKLWRSMSEPEKLPWQDLAKKDKARYEAEMANYKPPDYLNDSDEKNRMLKDLIKKDPSAPKPPKVAYWFYSSAKREELHEMLPNISSGELMKKITSSWRELSAEDKKPWIDLAKTDKLRFESELRSYKPLGRTKREVSAKNLLKNDPNAPKPPKTAFAHFQGSKRPGFTDQYPNLSYKEISKLIGKQWRSLSEVEKQEWKEIAMEDDIRYQTEIKEYRSHSYLCDFIEEPNITKQKENLTLAPKKPKTAYMFFFHAKKEEIMATKPGMTHNDCASITGKIWRTMTEEERQPYAALASADRVRYESELHPLQIKKHETKKKKCRRDPNAPKPAKSAFMYVLEAKRDEILQFKPDLTYNELSKEVGKLWHSLSDAEKQPWRDLAAEDKARYDAEMANYDPPIMEEIQDRKKRKKVHHSPKPPRTAFMVFVSEKQEELHEEYPDIGYSEKMKRLAHIWTYLPQEEKSEWIEKARLDKIRYEKEYMEHSGCSLNAFV